MGVSAMNYGFKVNIRFSKASPFRDKNGKPPTQVLRNVSEIHFNYRDGNTGPLGYKPSDHEIGPESSIAFESMWHSTGITYRLSYIAEFETEAETTVARKF